MKSTSQSRRAAARQRTHRQQVGTALTVTVPCAHGPNLQHQVHIEVTRDGIVRHISSECTEHPPDEMEARVAEGLVGKDVYKRCDWVVRDFLAGISKNTRHGPAPQDLNSFSAEDQPLLHALFKQVRNKAFAKSRERIDNRQGASKPEYAVASMREENRRNLLAYLTRGLVVPACWNVTIASRLRLRKEDRKDTWICVNNTHVARYRGHGRFLLVQKGVDALIADTRRDADRDTSGRKACLICNKKAASLITHVKSKRHTDAVLSAVFDLCEQIAARLTRKKAH